jgi:cell wall assembly regulator SMI1
MNSNEFQILWQNFEFWLKKNTFFDGALNKGASEEEFNVAENTMSIRLPECFKEVYRVHNGQSINYPGVFPDGVLLPLDQIISHWKNWKVLENQNVFANIKSTPSEGVNPVWWDNKWIPIIYDESGNFCCIDLNPALVGNKGQIISFWRDSPERQIISLSYGEWFKQNVCSLIEGKYLYNSQIGRFELVEK